MGTAALPSSTLPAPAPAPRGAVPAHHRVRLHDHHVPAPVRPGAGQPGPQQSVRRSQVWPPLIPRQDFDLMPQRDVFERQRASVPCGRGQGHEHVSKNQQQQRLPPRRKRRWHSRSRQTGCGSNNGTAQDGGDVKMAALVDTVVGCPDVLAAGTCTAISGELTSGLLLAALVEQVREGRPAAPPRSPSVATPSPTKPPSTTRPPPRPRRCSPRRYSGRWQCSVQSIEPWSSRSRTALSWHAFRRGSNGATGVDVAQRCERALAQQAVQAIPSTEPWVYPGVKVATLLVVRSDPPRRADNTLSDESAMPIEAGLRKDA